MSVPVPLAGAGHLVAAARGGDPTAFEELLAPILIPAHKLAFTILAQREAAEDAVQEAALKAWKAVAMLRAERGDVRPWFLTIVANECRSVRRRRWWHLPGGSGHVEATGPSGQQLEGRAAEAIDLRNTVAHLSSEKRLVLALVYWLDLPIEEVARVLGVSEAAARSRLRRAVLALRSAYTTDEDPRGTNLPAQSGHAMANRFEEIR
ncbi:MAG: sigma-70 family RNA polymerase sigma factor [Candidatus Dormiibacterota bacterium]